MHEYISLREFFSVCDFVFCALCEVCIFSFENSETIVSVQLLTMDLTQYNSHNNEFLEIDFQRMPFFQFILPKLK